jgi:hypothetical protein
MRVLKLAVPIFGLTLSLWVEPVPVTAQAPAVVALEAAAIAAANHGYWEAAAAFYTEAATIRGFGDEGAIDDLATAAALHYYRGDRAGALSIMTGAARQAVASGHVLKAAESYVDAAWIALELGLTPTVREFAYSATLLARSPHLSDVESYSILERLPVTEVTLMVSER